MNVIMKNVKIIKIAPFSKNKYLIHLFNE